MKEDIGKIWAMEVREKKRTASGVHSKTSKRGYVGKMRFATDLMSRKEQREYTKPSEVRSYTVSELVYESILPYEEFKILNPERQKELLEKWREHHKNTDIMEKMGIQKKAFYDLTSLLGVSKKERAWDVVPPKQREAVSEEELQEILNSSELIPYEDFKKLPRDQQVEVFFNYDKRFKRTPLFAQAWKGTSNSILYNLRSELKKYEEKRKKNEEKMKDSAKEPLNNKQVEKEEEPATPQVDNSSIKEAVEKVVDISGIDIPALQESLFNFLNKSEASKVEQADVKEVSEVEAQTVQEVASAVEVTEDELEQQEQQNDPTINELIDKSKDNAILALEEKINKMEEENKLLQSRLEELIKEKEQAVKQSKPEHLQDVNVSGFKFNLTGEFSSNMLVNKLTKIIPFVAGGDRYYLDLNIIEKESSED